MDNPAIDLNAVAIFAKVVERSSFRGAALALGMPRSTVSAKVAELELALGARLLDRTTRIVRPSEAGRAYLQAVAPALASLLDARRALADLQTAPAGHLRVTAPPELGYLVFGPVLATYRERAPDVSVSVELAARQVDLIGEGFDVAIRAGELVDSSLVARKLGAPQDLHVYASPGYLRRRGTPAHPAELVDHECLIMTERRDAERWPFQRGRRRFAVDVRGHIAINSFAVLRDLAVAGCGVTRLPPFFARPQVAARTLRPLLEPYALRPVAFHAVYPRSRNVSAKVRVFIEVLTETCRRLFP